MCAQTCAPAVIHCARSDQMCILRKAACETPCMFALHQVQPAAWGWAGGCGAGERCKLASWGWAGGCGAGERHKLASEVTQSTAICALPGAEELW